MLPDASRLAERDRDPGSSRERRRASQRTALRLPRRLSRARCGAQRSSCHHHRRAVPSNFAAVSDFQGSRSQKGQDPPFPQSRLSQRVSETNGCVETIRRSGGGLGHGSLGALAVISTRPARWSAQPASGRVPQASMTRRVSWAMASSSLVGTTRIVTGESGVEITRGSLARTAFFSSSMTRPR